MGYYRKFIQNFSSIANPLTTLLKKENQWKWTSEEQENFELIKSKLIEFSILHYPDYQQERQVRTYSVYHLELFLILIIK